MDTNVLLDLLLPDEPHRGASKAALGRALLDGVALVSDIVYAELAAWFLLPDDLEAFLIDVGMRRHALATEALHLAGRGWRAYLERRPRTLVCASCGTSKAVDCDRCGAPIAPRQHMLSDFLIGAHAAVSADRLLTRDRGFYRTYFRDLQLMETDPS